MPDLDPADVARGYPTMKEDGSPFDQDDFIACVREVRPQATSLGDDTNVESTSRVLIVRIRRWPLPHIK